MAKIIVGYDGREASDDALELGRKLAQAYGDELVVAAAYGFEQRPEPDEGNYFERRTRYFDQTFARAKEHLGSMPFTTEAIDDLPARGLFTLAEEQQPRLTVVGSTTRSRLGRVLLGSTGESLLGSAAIGAIAVAPRGYARSEHPHTGRAGVGFDGHDDSARAVREAARLAIATDADLWVVAARPVLKWPDSVAGPVEFSEPELEEAMWTLAGVKADGARTQLVICAGEPAEELAKLSVEFDLLVVGSRGYGPVRRALLGSTSRAVIRDAACPVMIVPRGEETPRTAFEAAGTG